MTFRHEDGSLVLAQWGAGVPGTFRTDLRVSHEALPLAMFGTPATGDRMVSNGHLGVDLIRVPAGEGFAPHTHPGDHLLIAVAGEGTVTVDGSIYPTHAGQVYMVEGAQPHAVGAITDHVILAVGAPHRNIDAADRMTLTDYAAVAARLGHLRCLVCHGTPYGTSDQLRAAGCPHAPREAPTTRPLVVGLAPATEDHAARGLRPFEQTASGGRLAALLDVSADRLLEVVDTINLSPHYLPHWESVGVGRWATLARQPRISEAVSGRVVVCAGHKVAEALGAWWPGLARAVVPVPDGWPEARPFLAVCVPHPQTVTHDPGMNGQVMAALALARNLARTGPLDGKLWGEADSDAFNEAVPRLAADMACP